MLKAAVRGYIINFRKGPKTQKNNELIIEIPGVNSRTEASKYVGKKAVIKLNDKEIIGKIIALHGSRGKLRARFGRGLPGKILSLPALII
jgi:large subunit ribosomal protein L35Ae